MVEATATLSPAERQDRRSLHLGWSVGTLGVAILLNTQNAAALFFFVTVLKIEPWLAGAIITGSKIYDVVTDPLMGTISDRTESRWGRRRPYLLSGGLACGVAFALLFAVPPLPSESVTIVYVTAALLLAATAYTVFNVPYLAMPAEMIEDYNERSQLMSYRVVFISIGTFIAVSGTPVLLGLLENHLGVSPRGAYAVVGIVYGMFIAAAMVGSFYGTRHAVFTERVETRLSFLSRLRLVFRNKPFVLFLGIKLCVLFAAAATLAVKFFFVTVVMQRNIEIAGIFGIASLVGQLSTLPIWLRAAKRHGKKWIAALSAVLMALLAFTWLLSGPEESLWIYGLRGLFLGAAGGGVLLGAQAMLPDVIEYDYRSTGLRREGMFAGFASFVEKLAFTLSAAAVGGYLSFMGFDRNLPPDQQPSDAVFAVLLCQTVLPAALFGLCGLLLYFYDLDEKKLKAAQPPKADQP